MNAKFPKPLGLALSGTGALGAWQFSWMKTVSEAGVGFDKIVGFSGGAVHAAAYALGSMDHMLKRWKSLTLWQTFDFRPRLFPFSLFGQRPLVEAIAFAQDESSARARAKCEFTVVALCLNDMMPVYARFSPKGAGGWDSPLSSWLMASASIPRVMPNVRIEVRGKMLTFTDGGVPGREWLRLESLAGCEEVIVVQVVHPSEVGKKKRFSAIWRDQDAREVVHRHMSNGIDSLRELPKPPKRIYRICPSQPLGYSMLDFRASNLQRAYEMGERDGKAFLAAPESFVLAS